MAITRAQQFRQMLKKGGEPVVQGGVENYLGDQPQVVVPRKWQSGPDKPPTELAYITEAEKKLLLKEDIHGSLKDGPNEGPAGVMSLDSFGDIGGAGAGGADTEAGGGAKEGAGFSGRGAGEFGTDRKSQKAFEDRIKNQKAALQIAERKQAKDLSELLGRDIKERKNIADYGSADSLQRLFMRGVGDSNIPGFLGMGLNAITGLRNIGLRKNIDFYRNDPRTAKARAKYGVSAEGYKEYMAERLAGNIDAAGNERMRDREEDDDDENQLLLAQAVNPNQATTPTEETPAIDPVFFRLLADGGMPEDAPVGGIMDLETSRQMYGLGKLVKKATRAVKKIVKSPIGKAALLYFGGQALTGGGLGTFLKKKAMPFLFEGGKFSGGLTGGGKLALGGALTLAPLLFQEEEEDEPIDEASLGPRLDIAGLLANPYRATLGTGFRRTAADGGRMGYADGTMEAGAMMSEEDMKKLAKSPLYKGFKMMYGVDPQEAKNNKSYEGKFKQFEQLYKKGFQKGGDVEPVAKKTMPLLDMGGKEMDLRDNGGFVPIGRMEKADDVPARLSKNEFVFTADAVRNAGDGDVDKGAEVMYNMMKNLEDGGDVSEESQGLEGARNMFQTAQRLEEVL